MARYLTTVAHRLSPRAHGNEAIIVLPAVVAGIVGSVDTVITEVMMILER